MVLRQRRNTQHQRAVRAYEKLTEGLVKKLLKFYRDGTGPNGLAWSNQKARAEVAIRAHRFMSIPLKKALEEGDAARIIGLQKYCDQKLAMRMTSRIARANPFLLGLTALDVFFDDLQAQNHRSICRTKDGPFAFLEKHVIGMCFWV